MRSLGISRKGVRRWTVFLLPGLLLRTLIPVGFMPMFGPGFSIGLMLCPAYAPIPDLASTGPSAAERDRAAAVASIAMPGMDMSMDMPMAGGAADKAARSPSDSGVPAPGGASRSSNGTDHQYDSLYHYLANAIAAALPTWVDPIVAEPPATAVALPAPQVAYFELSPRAQSARAPPLQI